MRTLEAVGALDPLPVTALAASHWARIRVLLAEAGRKANVNDLWIASVALANDMPVLTQDADFEVFSELGVLDVLRV
jgi:predicted nucleic acid-binding protein